MPAARARSGVLSRGLTIRGRCLLAGGLAATICAWLLDERDLIKVGALAVLLPLIAMVMSVTRRPKVHVKHHVPTDLVTVGQPTTVSLELRNSRRFTVRGVAIIEPPTREFADGLSRRIRTLPARATLCDSYPALPQRRGRFTVGPTLLAFGDALGMWEDIRAQPGEADILVVPAVHQLTGLPTRGGRRSTISGVSGTGTGTGEVDVLLRPYTAGDDIRTINWRASARMDEFFVRLRQQVVDSSAAILIDYRANAHYGIGAASSLEYGISLTASVLAHLDALGHSVRLCGPTGQILIEGHDVTEAALAHLALLEPTDCADLAADPGPDGGFGATGLVVAVLGATNTVQARALVSAKPRSARAIAFLLDSAGFATHPVDVDQQPARLTLTEAGWQVVQVGPQDAIETVWQRACQQQVRAG